MKSGRVIIRFDCLEYTPKSIIVDEDKADEIYLRLKRTKRYMGGKIKNLRRT